MGRIKTEMEVVIDSNKIISAVVSRGIVRKIVTFSGINFYAPEELVEEIARALELSKLSRLSRQGKEEA